MEDGHGMSEALEARDAALLVELASAPRPTGGRRLSALRARCAAELGALGYEVVELPFGYSTLPGRFGTPLVGALVMAAVAVAGHWGARGASPRWLPLLVLVASGAAAIVVGRWLAGRAVLDAPWLRADGVNVEAVRPGERVAVWLCAHLDSKSQPVPTLARTVGIAIESLGAALTLLLALAAAAGLSPSFEIWAGAAALTLAGAVPVVLSVTGSRSPGALDNASGVVTVLAAARELADTGGIGIVLTDAEELGLAGAHAWTRKRRAALVLNCDGVDDVGGVQLLHAGAAPEEVLRAAREAARLSGVAFRPRRLPLGVLTDSVAVARGGGVSLTFSRGTWGSLLRVHSTRDDLSRLSGAGIPGTAALLAATARELVQSSLLAGRPVA